MKKIILFLFILNATFVVAKGTANSPYEAGLHYQLIEPTYAIDDSKNVIIYEFFGYKCPHCASFQPYMESLHNKLPSYAKVIRVPLGFNPSWKVLAQSYYAAESLGIIEKSHQAMFDALHKQHKKLRSIEDIADWYQSEFGIDKEKFLATANSFMVDNMVKKGNNIATKMQIPNTPKLVINGKYMPMVTALGSNEAVIDLTLQLVKQEGQNMGLK